MNTRSAQTPFALLRALARLTRRRVPPTPERLAVRAGCEAADVPLILSWLTRQGLVVVTRGEPRLTLAGLAFAVASRRAAPVARSAGTTSRAA